MRASAAPWLSLSGTASVDIDAPLEEVWKVVEDVLDAPNWQGGLDGMTALAHDDAGRPTLVETENDLKVRRVKTRVRFSYDGPARLSWKQEKGDLKSVDGSWRLEDLGGGRTRATYALEVDPGASSGCSSRARRGAIMALFVNGRPGELRRRLGGE